MMTNKELSMRLKKVGFEGEHTETWQAPAIYNKEVSIEEVIRQEYEVMVLRKNGHFPHHEIPAYDAGILFEWLRGWHRDDPFRSFEIQHDGIAVFDWGPRDSDKWIEYKTSLADMMAEAILWILEDNDAQTKD